MESVMQRNARPYYWLPKGVGHQDIRRAAAEIDRNGVPGRLGSRSFDVVVGNKVYPAKHLVRLAAKHATGTEPRRFHAHQAVELLRKLGYSVIDRKTRTDKTVAVEDDESAFPEGRTKFSWHRKLERDATISRRAKQKRLSDVGKLACDVCKFDFARAYGDLGEGFIEAHHTIPVSKLDGKARTKVNDLALVCSNCHRMLHRKPLHTVEELRKLVRRFAKN
jgi:predicted HNH restriction endonuclease